MHGPRALREDVETDGCIAGRHRHRQRLPGLDANQIVNAFIAADRTLDDGAGRTGGECDPLLAELLTLGGCRSNRDNQGGKRNRCDDRVALRLAG